MRGPLQMTEDWRTSFSFYLQLDACNSKQQWMLIPSVPNPCTDFSLLSLLLSSDSSLETVDAQ
jgi:hypothetical protein